MKKNLLLLFIISSLTANAQIGFQLNNNIPVSGADPLDLAWAGGLNFSVFSEINLNGDARPDLFAFDRSNNRTLTFINNGGTGIHCWEYAPQYEKHFPRMRGWAFLYDYNCDGKQDLFTVNSYNNGIAQYRNDTQGGNLLFTFVDSSIQFDFGGPVLSNILASGNLVPNFDDIDGDGDMDILGLQFQCAGGFAYYKNMSMEEYGVCDSLNDYILVTNVWGAFTLRSGLYQNVAVGSWNVSCFQTPGGGGSYEIAERDDTYANIRTIDLDGDGDKDALIGDSQTKNSLMVTNGGNNINALMVPPQDTLFPSYNTPVSILTFAMHSFADADNDGITDLLVTQSEYENNRGVLFYKNTGTNAIPVYNYQMNDFLQNEMIDVGESATPVLFDFDSDGLLDIVIGNKLKTTGPGSSTTTLSLYRNIGTLTAPSFQFVTDDFAGIQSQLLTGQIYPAFGDLDGDNDMDMLVGLDNGKFVYFENIAGPGVTVVFGPPVFNYMSIDVGLASTPQLIDLERDGLLDIISGGKNGLVKYYRNLGSSSIPFFAVNATIDTLGGIVVQAPLTPDGYSVPFLFEQNGDYRLFVSSMNGDIYLYGNIDGNTGGIYTLLDTVYSKVGGSRISYNISVSGGDLNNDTLTDMLVGLYGGGMQIFYQDNSINSVSDVQNTEDLRVYPNPASEFIVVKSTHSELNMVCELFDLNGQLLKSSVLKGNYSVVDVRNFSSGVYLLKVSSGKSILNKKIVLQK